MTGRLCRAAGSPGREQHAIGELMGSAWVWTVTSGDRLTYASKRSMSSASWMVAPLTVASTTYALGEPTLFLGAGVSVSLPAGAPLFRLVRDACAESLGIDVSDWEKTPRQTLLDHTIPEIFLAALTRAGLHLNTALANAVAGPIGSQPNAVHHAVAKHLARGGCVWTTNWDTFIEEAYSELTSRQLTVLVPGRDAPSRTTKGVLVKLHGTAKEPSTLRFLPSEVIPPLASPWAQRLIADMRNRPVIVVGYAGADVDIYPALNRALRQSALTYWLEMGGSWAQSPAPGEVWRYELDGRLDWTDPAPTSGRHLLWCGVGAVYATPSDGLLALLGETVSAGPVPPWRLSYQHVGDSLERFSPTRTMAPAAIALARGTLADRLGLSKLATQSFLRALVSSDPVVSSRAARLLTYKILRRVRQAPPPVTRALSAILWNNARRTLMRGSTTWEAPTPAQVSADLSSPTHAPDILNDHAAATRWMGNLETAQQLARRAHHRSLEQDLDTPGRDWTERIARASFEIANSALWQGRHRLASDECRKGYMQLTGGKWAAWDFTMRAAIHAIADQADAAQEYIQLAENLVGLQRWEDAWASIYVTKAQCARLRGDIATADDAIHQAERWCAEYAQMQSMVRLEMAELDLTVGNTTVAQANLTRITAGSVPITRGLAALRLAETLAPAEAATWVDTARGQLGHVQCLWGLRRLDALKGHPHTVEQLEAEGLVPALCRPDGPWVF